MLYALAGVVAIGGVPVLPPLPGPHPGGLVVLVLIAVLVVVTGALSTAHIPFSIPLLRGTQLGVVGADFGTIAFSLGLLCLFVEMARPNRHTPTIVACVVLMVGPFFAHQRAALIGGGV